MGCGLRVDVEVSRSEGRPEKINVTLPRRLIQSKPANLSERKLMDCLNRLGYDIEIKVKLAAKPLGHLMLAVA